MPSSSSSSSDEDEDAVGASESTAHAQEKDQEKERKRQRKERKEKKEKKEKKHKKEKKEKKEKHKHKDKKAKRAADDPAALAAARAAVEASMQPIAESDYFLRTKEFQLWLSEARGTFLDEIPAEEARSLFRKFVAKWNAKELPPKYYVGLASRGEGGAGGADGATRASRHVWGFTSNITEQERFQLDRAKVAVEAKSAGSAEQEALARAESRAQLMLERQQFRKHGKDVMEELVPRADPGSREARLEKRGAQTAYHRAGARDESAGLERPDAELMGGNTGSDSFAAAVARRSQQQARRADERSARHAELQAKEDARNAAFRASMAGFL